VYQPLWAIHITDKITTDIKLFPCKQSKTVEDNEFQQSWITLCCYKKQGGGAPPHIILTFIFPQVVPLMFRFNSTYKTIVSWSNWLLGALDGFLPLRWVRPCTDHRSWPGWEPNCSMFSFALREWYERKQTQTNPNSLFPGLFGWLFLLRYHYHYAE